MKALLLKALLLASAALAALALLVPPAALATTGTLIVTSDTTLSEDHQGSIVVASDAVTLNCDGHTVSGPGNVGIDLSGRTSVTVKNCTVTGFSSHGFAVAVSHSNILSGNAAIGNGVGFALGSADDNQLVNNTALRNEAIGFQLVDSHRNYLANVACV